MSKKISYASVISDVLNGEPLTPERIERLEALRVSLEKRASRKAGPTKTQIANAEIGEAIIEAMNVGESYAIADIKALVPALAEATPQKVGPICRKLVVAGRLAESKVKGKVVYSLAE